MPSSGIDYSMNTNLNKIFSSLNKNPKVWLITGAAGFIGSHLVRTLLSINQKVIGLDNFSTGKRENLDAKASRVEIENLKNFTFVQGDISNYDDCEKALTCLQTRKFNAQNSDVDIVLHHAALGSVPRSILDPLKTNTVNISGFLNMLHASKERGVKRFIYAASSSTYGDSPNLPKVEETIGKPLSPYAITKYVNEMYADIYKKCYGIDSIGLRYFNVFGPLQNPDGAYAAVIPKWIKSIIDEDHVLINGDGSTSRDFTSVDNVVQANILAATTNDKYALNQVYNIALGRQTSLNKLLELIMESVKKNGGEQKIKGVVNAEFRDGDILHSLADIAKAKRLLKYEPSVSIEEGISKTVSWWLQDGR